MTEQSYLLFSYAQKSINFFFRYTVIIGESYKKEEDSMAKENPRQISSFTNNKAVVELMNKLKPATPGKGSHLHRSGEKDNAGHSLSNSMIGINLVDYEKNPSIFVQENLTPSQVKELYQEAIMKRNNYNFSGNGQKIFGNPDENGYSIVRTLKINRQGSFVQNGNTVTKNYPWTITIQNGKGIKEVNQKTGGTSCKKGSFVVEKEAKIVMADGDFFALFEEANTSFDCMGELCGAQFYQSQ